MRDERQNNHGLRRKFRQTHGYFDFPNVRLRKTLPSIHRREMLKLGGAHSRAMTRGMTNFQAVPRPRRGDERVVKQKSGQDQTDPPALS